MINSLALFYAVLTLRLLMTIPHHKKGPFQISWFKFLVCFCLSDVWIFFFFFQVRFAPPEVYGQLNRMLAATFERRIAQKCLHWPTSSIIVEDVGVFIYRTINSPTCKKNHKVNISWMNITADYCCVVCRPSQPGWRFIRPSEVSPSIPSSPPPPTPGAPRAAQTQAWTPPIQSSSGLRYRARLRGWTRRRSRNLRSSSQKMAAATTTRGDIITNPRMMRAEQLLSSR